jgi:hypothetical protein
MVFLLIQEYEAHRLVGPVAAHFGEVVLAVPDEIIKFIFIYFYLIAKPLFQSGSRAQVRIKHFSRGIYGVFANEFILIHYRHNYIFWVEASK